MTELPLVKLPHFVTVEDLSSEQVLSLIHRAEFYKDGGETPKLTKPVYVTNAFLKTQLGLTRVLKLRKNALV